MSKITPMRHLEAKPAAFSPQPEDLPERIFLLRLIEEAFATGCEDRLTVYHQQEPGQGLSGRQASRPEESCNVLQCILWR